VFHIFKIYYYKLIIAPMQLLEVKHHCTHYVIHVYHLHVKKWYKFAKIQEFIWVLKRDSLV